MAKNIEKVQAEKDLGVIIDAEFKFYAQCSAVVNKANQLLWLIKKNFLCITPEMFTSLYKALVRPVLEYWNLICGPHYITDMHKLENIQRKAIASIFEAFRRLQTLKLPTLQYRWQRGDMITLYNILHDKYDINFYCFKYIILIKPADTISSLLRIIATRTDVRKNFFARRVITLWNN